MNAEKYKQYQEFKNSLFFFTDKKFNADESFGNVLFQRMADAAFEVFSKFEEKSPCSCEKKSE